MLARASACGAGPASGRLNTEDDVDLRQARERVVGIGARTLLEHQEALSVRRDVIPDF